MWSTPTLAPESIFAKVRLARRRCSTRFGSNLTHKDWTWVEIFDTVKHASLLHHKSYKIHRGWGLKTNTGVCAINFFYSGD